MDGTMRDRLDGLRDETRVRRRVAAAALVALAVAAFVLFRAPFLSVPLERDEGEYAYVAQRLLAGDVPYRDAFNQKPPGVFGAYALAFALLGPSIEAIHLFAYLWTAGTAVLLFVLMRALASPLAAAFAVLAFSVASTDPRLEATAANTELFTLLPVVASMVCLLRALASERVGWWLACGACAGAACWFKQVAVAHALFLAVVACVRRPGREGRGPAVVVARRLVALAGGAAAVSAPVLLAFAAVGAWRPFVDAVLLHNLDYALGWPVDQGLVNLRLVLVRQAQSLAGLWLAAAVGVAAHRPGRGLLVGWLAASLAAVAVGLRFWPHYWVQTLPALSALAGAGLAALAVPLLARRRLAAVAVAALAALLLVPPAVANRGVLLAGSPEAVSRAIYGANPFPESVEIARRIRESSAPDEFVYVVGSEPQILFYAQRRSATRYIIFYPLTGLYPDALERQRAAVAEVQERRPRYVVWVDVGFSHLIEPESERFVFSATREMLRRDYGLEFVVRPDSEGRSFEFAHGAEAARWLSEDYPAEPKPWVGVYRRRFPGAGGTVR
jgi:hypothetical protein